jgi:acyl carrier protein
LNRPEELSRSIGAWLARELKLPKSQIEPDKTFVRYGMDSMQAMMLVGDLEQLLARRLPPTLAWDYPTQEAMAKHLGSEAVSAAAEESDDSEILARLDDLSEDEIDRLLQERVLQERM